jgi:hypothetical protein
MAHEDNNRRRSLPVLHILVELGFARMDLKDAASPLMCFLNGSSKISVCTMEGEAASPHLFLCIHGARSLYQKSQQSKIHRRIQGREGIWLNAIRLCFGSSDTSDEMSIFDILETIYH